MSKKITKVAGLFEKKYLNKVSSYYYQGVDDLYNYANSLWSKRSSVVNNSKDPEKVKRALKELLGITFHFKKAARKSDLGARFVKKYISAIKKNVDTLMMQVTNPEVRDELGDLDYQTNLVYNELRGLPKALQEPEAPKKEKSPKEDVEENVEAPPVPQYLLEGYKSQEEYDRRPRTFEAVQDVRRDLFDL